MLFRKDAKTWLRDFTKSCGNKTSIAAVGKRKLSKWALLTDETDAQYLREYMSPDLWGHSADSLRTALAIVTEYTPRRFAGIDALQQTITALRLRILKVTKRPDLKLKPAPKPTK